MFDQRKIWLLIRGWEEDGRRGGGISLENLIVLAQERYPNEYTGRSWVERPLQALIANGTAEYRGHLINTLHTGDDLYTNAFVFWNSVSENFGFWRLFTIVSGTGALITALLPGGIISELIDLLTNKSSNIVP